MKTGLVIFNGIQFPFHLADRAIEWAVANQGQLRGLFIHSMKEPPEGYVFPSDIDPAENMYDKEDARKSNIGVIRSQMALFIDMARAKNIMAHADELVNPPLDSILDITKNADSLFLDHAHDNAYLLSITHFHAKDIIRHSHCPVEVVSHKK